MGVYIINIRRKEGEDTVASTTALETLEFSDEYRRDLSNANFISFIENNGRMLETGTKLYTKVKGVNQNKRDITDIIIILSIVMLLIDIVIRRFDLSRRLVSLGSSGTHEKPKKNDIKQSNVIKPEAVSVEASQSVVNQDVNGVQTTDSYAGTPVEQEVPGKKHRKKKNKPKEEPQSEGLDMATLLQKKKDRNL